MKTFKEIAEIINRRRDVISERHKVLEIAIFGSFAGNSQNEKSDLDLLVKFVDDKVSIFDTLELKYYLEEITGLKVDIVTKEALKPNIGKRILEEAVYI